MSPELLRRASLLAAALGCASCVYLPPTGVLFAIEDSLSEADELQIDIFDETGGRMLVPERRVVRPREPAPRARCLSVVPESGLTEGGSRAIRVRFRTVKRLPDGSGEVTSSAAVRTTMRFGERRLVRVPLTAACGRTQSSACLARPLSATDCGGYRCRCGPAGCLDDARTCGAADTTRPDEVTCAVEPQVDQGVLTGTTIDDDGCLAAL